MIIKFHNEEYLCRDRMRSDNILCRGSIVTDGFRFNPLVSNNSPLRSYRRSWRGGPLKSPLSNWLWRSDVEKLYIPKMSLRYLRELSPLSRFRSFTLRLVGGKRFLEVVETEVPTLTFVWRHLSACLLRVTNPSNVRTSSVQRRYLKFGPS